MGIWAITLGLLYSFVLGFCCYKIGAMNPVQEVAMAEVPIEQAMPTFAPEETPKNAGFLVKEYNSRIGVYRNGELIRILDIDTSSLRSADKEALSEGIPFETNAEVAQFIEDYSS
jgi:hypothetical protein